MKKLALLTAIATVTLSTSALAKDVKTATPAIKAPATATQELSIDSKKEVAYNCTINGNSQKLTVMYGIKDGQITLAQVKVNQEISPGLFRVQDGLVNRFVSAEKDGTMWTTMPATPATLASVDGGILSHSKNGTNEIIVEKCKLDKAETAKLAK